MLSQSMEMSTFRKIGPDGINFVFPVSQPTLKKEADHKIFI